MKDFKIGQKVFLIRDYNKKIVDVEIIKKFENTKRWKVKIDLKKEWENLYYEERFVERFKDDYELFSTFEEAYSYQLNKFDKEIEEVNKEKKEFIENNKNDTNRTTNCQRIME